MSNPSCVGFTTDNSTTNQTTHTVDISKGNAGERVIIKFSCDTEGSTTASIAAGWTELFNAVSAGNIRIAAWYRDFDGSESDTVNITTSDSQMSAVIVARYLGYEPSIAPQVSSFSTATSTAPNTSAIAPAWSSDEALFLTIIGWSDGTSTVSAYPTSYDHAQGTTTANDADGVGIAFAARQNAATIEDPGAFTLTNSEVWYGYTVAIRRTLFFPDIEGTDSGNVSTDGTTHTVDLSTCQAGERVFICLCSDENATTSIGGSGWNSLINHASGANHRLSVWWKEFAGTEGSSVDVTTSAAQMSAWAVVRLSGHDPDTDPEVSSTSTGTSGSPNPNGVTPTWGTGDTLWLAVMGWNDADLASLTAYPANYTLNQTTDSSAVSGGVGVAVCGRQLEASTEDPGTFSISSSRRWNAFTIAVKFELEFSAVAPVVVGGASGAATATFTGGSSSYTATCDAVAGGATGSASATFTPPTFDADCNAVCGGATGSASASFSPGTKTATSAAIVGGATGAADATFAPGTKTATSDAVAGGATGAATATHTPPTFEATCDAVAGGASGSASATFATVTFTSTCDAVAGGATGAATATFTAPVYDGTSDAIVGGATGSATATHTAPTFEATCDAVAGGATGAATAVFASGVFSANCDAVAGGASGSATATHVAPTYEGTCDAIVGGATGAATAASVATYTGTCDAIAGGASGSASAAFTPPTFTATCDAVTGGATSTSTAGENIIITGVGNCTMAKPAISTKAWAYAIELTPDENLTSGNAFMSVADFLTIDDHPVLAPDAEFSYTNASLNTGVSAIANFGLTDTPDTFVHPTSCVLIARQAAYEAQFLDDFCTTYAQIKRADGTALTQERLIRQFSAANVLQQYVDYVSLPLQNASSQSRADWDGAYIVWRCEGTRFNTGDGARMAIHGLRVGLSFEAGVYTATCDAIVSGIAMSASVNVANNATYTATCDAALGGVVGSSSATHETPIYSGNANTLTGSVIGTASGTYVGGVYTATCEPSTAGVECTGSITFVTATFTAQANLSIPAASGSAAATLGVFSATCQAVTGGATASVAAQHAALLYQPDANVIAPGATGSATASFSAPIYTAAIEAVASGAACSAIASPSNPSYTATCDVLTGAASGAVAAAYDAGIYTATAFPSVRNIRGSAMSGFEYAVSAAASVQSSAATGQALARFIPHISNSAQLFIPAAKCRANASFKPREVLAVIDRTTVGVVDRWVSGIATSGISGRSNKPWWDDHGPLFPPETHDVACHAVAPAARCTIAASFSSQVFSASVSAIAGSVVGSVQATNAAPVYSASAQVLVGYPWASTNATFEPLAGAAAATVIAPAASASAQASFVPPTFTATVALVHSGADGNSVATFDAGSSGAAVNATTGATLAVVIAQFTRPVFTATVTRNFPRVRGASTAITVEDAHVASANCETAGVSCTGSISTVRPSFVASTQAVAKGMACSGTATMQLTPRVASVVGLRLVNQFSFAGSGTVFNPATRTASVAATTGGAIGNAHAQFGEVLRTGFIIAMTGGTRVAASAQFTLGPSGTTPLSQPHWLEWAEDYPYTKLGVAYNSTTYETILTENNVLTAVGVTDLQNKINQAKSQSAIDAIYVDPTAGPYQLGSNPFTGLSRPLNRPLVIRTQPGHSMQADLRTILQTGFYNGLALVDLKFEDLRLIAGGENTLIEKCVGWLDLQGTRTGPASPLKSMVNTHVRLSVMCDHWAPDPDPNIGTSILVHGLFFFNMDGVLCEGNIWDHNGWRPDGTRATSRFEGGPTFQKHNVYANRPATGVRFRYNWSSRGSSHGLHMKCGGRSRRNMLVRNPLSGLGYGADGTFNNFGLVTDAHWIDNTTIGADDIAEAQPTVYPNLPPLQTVPRGIHLWVTCVDGAVITGNVAVDNPTGPSSDAFVWLERNFEILNTQINNNRAAAWAANPIVHSAQGTYTPQYTQSGNNFSATFQGSAKTLADSLKTNSFIDQYKTSRQRLGVNISELKQLMDLIRAGVQ